MSAYRVEFNTTISLFVTVDASDDDEAGEAASVLASEYLNTVIGDSQHVRASADLDGIGADEIVEVQP